RLASMMVSVQTWPSWRSRNPSLPALSASASASSSRSTLTGVSSDDDVAGSRSTVSTSASSASQPRARNALINSAVTFASAASALSRRAALNGLRVSEATGADIERLGLERGHRTLLILRKGGKIVTIPLAPRTARAIDLAVGERCEGPIFLANDGTRLDRHGASRIVRRIARR